MERQNACDANDEREHLRRLKDELFEQPPLELFDDPQIQRRVAYLIERAVLKPVRRFNS